MGVKELWKLLQPAAYTVQSLDILSGKRVAVDISVWLHQFILGMGFEDDDGILFGGDGGGGGGFSNTNQTLQTRFLRALFKRICKLLYYNVKPVFIFDGTTPLVKQKTIQKRRMRSTKQNMRIKKAAKKLLNRVMQDSSSGSGSAAIAKKLENMKKAKMSPTQKKEEEEDFNFAIPSVDKKEDSILSDPRNYEFADEEFQEVSDTQESSGNSSMIDIDLNSEIDPEVFKALPKEIQQDVVKQLKSSKRYKTESHIKELKEKTPEKFSTSQLDAFIKGSSASIQLKKLLQISENQQIVNSIPTNQNEELLETGTSDEPVTIKDEQQEEEEEMGFFVEDDSASQPSSSQQTPSSQISKDNISSQHYQTVDAVKEMKQPLLIIHSKTDKVVDFKHSEILYSAASTTTVVDYWVVEDAPHSCIHRHLTAEFESRVVSFLEKHFL